MSILVVLPYYIAWHYSQALYDLLGIWRNFFIFIYKFFSIKDLFLTLFSPWQRMQEGLRKGFGLEELFATLVVNTIMRLVGAVVRSVVIILGIIALLVCLGTGLLVFLAWLLLPFLVLYLPIQGIIML